MHDISLTDKNFIEIYTDYYHSVYTYVFFRTYDKELAADISQQVFLKVYQHMASIIMEKAGAYCMTIARNALIDYWRTHKKQVSFDETVGGHESVESTSFIETADIHILASALENLDTLDSDIVRMRSLSGFSYEHISQVLLMPEATIRKRHSRSLAKMHAYIIEHFPHYEFKT
jgi:RNA polymerase sigma-70 factor (ECF subfamily)